MTRRTFATLFTASCVALAFIILRPSFARPRQKRQEPTCLNYLFQIDAAKVQWALEQLKTTNDTPSLEDLRPLLKLWPPTCPNGGTYSIGRVGEMPKCSISNDTARFRAAYQRF